ncbi:MAG: hypothetical protein V4631_10110 [Pseudomonadota bacterium]
MSSITVSLSRARALSVGVAVVCLLGACGKEASSAPRSAAAKAGSAPRDTYEMVSVVRPESLQQYMKRLRFPYDLCAGQAKLQGQPIKPFPAIPDDFVVSRITLVSDGKSFSRSEVVYSVTIEGLTPETGCAAKLESDVHTSVVRDGVQLRAAEAGQPTEEPLLVPTQAFKDEQTAGYTVARTVHGVALKCLDSKSVAIAAGFASDSCIVDPAVARIAGPDGDPTLAHQRDIAAAAATGAIMVLEPVSLKVGHKVDPARFSIVGFK